MAAGAAGRAAANALSKDLPAAAAFVGAQA